MGQVTGIIEAKTGKSKYGTYGILVNGSWYNSKFEIKANKGDSVTFDDGGKNYVKGLKASGSGGDTAAAKTTASSTGGRSFGKFPIPELDGQRAIIRQNAVTNANSFLATESVSLDSDPITVDRLIEVARQIEAYTAGDLDAMAAESLIEAATAPEDMV